MSFSDFGVDIYGIKSVEDCAVFRSQQSYSWDDIPCSRNYQPVCEAS